MNKKDFILTHISNRISALPKHIKEYPEKQALIETYVMEAETVWPLIGEAKPELLIENKECKHPISVRLSNGHCSACGKLIDI